MANEMLAVLRKERDALVAELEANPAFEKFRKVEELIELYAAGEPAPRAIRPPPSVPVKTIPQSVPSRPNSKLANVEKVVLDHLWATSQRATSGQLLTILTAKGIELGGKVPSKTLASMLSNSNRLNNLAGYGYGPVEWGQSPRPGTKEKAPADLPESASNQERVPTSMPGLPLMPGMPGFPRSGQGNG